VDEEFLETTTYRMAAIAEGYGSPREVWQALKDNPGLAVVDGLPAPRRSNFVRIGAPQSDFHLEGFWLEDETFSPVPVEVRDPITGNQTTLTVVGVLTDVVAPFMIGLTASQSVMEQVFPEQSQPNAHLIRCGPAAMPKPYPAPWKPLF
jgi:hypothetical protein